MEVCFKCLDDSVSYVFICQDLVGGCEVLPVTGVRVVCFKNQYYMLQGRHRGVRCAVSVMKVIQLDKCVLKIAR